MTTRRKRTSATPTHGTPTRATPRAPGAARAGPDMPAPLAPFDVFAAPLEGTQLLEASAGTGKTWTLTALHLRLLLEADLPIAGILVVTFTEAAVAELRTRIRQRLVDAQRVLGLSRSAADGTRDAPAGDAAVVRIVERARAVLAAARASRGDARNTGDTEADAVDRVLSLRVARALASFDDAPIRTIHAFCQGVLRESAFAAHLPLEVQTLTDDTELRRAAVADFWRREVASPALPTDLAAWLARGDIGPERWQGVLRDVLAFPLARQLWRNDDGASIAAPYQALEQATARARRSWQADHTRALESLNDATRAPSYTSDRIRRAHALWEHHLARESSDASLPADPKDVLKLYRTSWLESQKRFAKGVPRLALFDDIEALLEAQEAVEQHLRAATSALKRRMVEHASRSLDDTKAEQGIQTFQDMLTRTHDRLRDDAALASSVRQRYPAALIDEFQDTDPVQLGIFERLYDGIDDRIEATAARARGCVFMVGDPKQAIYAFRGADLASYLLARDREGRRAWSLDHNQRASPDLLGAVNALFLRHRHVFGDSRLAYRRSDAGPAPRKPFVDARGVTGAAMRVWSLPADIATVADAQQAAARACAADIARTLDAARAGDVRYDDRALRGGDIAVLVRANKEGQAMRRALAEVGVTAVELSPVSVFASVDAAEVEVLLHAVLEPSHAGKLRAAMATTLLGAEAEQLAALRAPAADAAGEGDTDDGDVDRTPTDADALLDTTLARLLAWRGAWQRHGVAAMLARVLADAGVAERLLPGADGERRLTNLLHLMELLGHQEQLTPLPQALLRWLGTQRQDPGTRDEALLRLESDRQLVQIVTVHRAKGLEYPIVHLPFLWCDGPNKPREGGALRWHDDNDRQVLDLREPQDIDDEAKARQKDEATAESLRLAYVALTRAVHRCTLVIDPHAHDRRYANLRSTLNWIVAAPPVLAGSGFEDWRRVDKKTAPARSAQILRAWRALAAETPHVDLRERPDVPVDVPTLANNDAALDVERFATTGPIEASWRAGSFSSFLHGEHGDAGAVDLIDAFEPALAGSVDRDAPAFDGDVDSDDTTEASLDVDTPGEAPIAAATRAVDARAAVESITAATLPDDDIVHFPRGTSAGDAMHAALERADFTRPASWPLAAAAALRLHPQRAATGHAQAMLEGMLRHVAAVDLLPGVALAQVGPAQRANEVEFDLPMCALRLDRLHAAMHRAGLPVPPLGGASPRTAHAPLHGHLRGFVDTVFEHRGRWYLADWKSNHLGDTPADYAQPALERAITAQGYHLQHVLYGIALLRHLRLTLGHTRGRAAAEAAWGGAFVLFVRGMRPGWVDADGRPTGVFHRRLEPSLLDALAEGFGEATTAGDQA